MNKVLLVSSASNWADIDRTLDFAKRNLPNEVYEDCAKSCKKSITQILLALLVWTLLVFTLASVFVRVGDSVKSSVVASYGATHYEHVVRKDDNTVLYARENIFEFDTSVVGIPSLTDSYPNERVFIALLDSKEDLVGLIPGSDLVDRPSVSEVGIILSIIVPTLLFILYGVVFFGKTKYGKRWRVYQEFAASNGDVKVLEKLGYYL